MNRTITPEAGAVADVAAIARGLSAGQRLAVISTVPGEARPYSEIEKRGRTRLFLNGLLEHAADCADTRCRLTPLGIAVRQHLEQGATAGGVGGKEAAGG